MKVEGSRISFRRALLYLMFNINGSLGEGYYTNEMIWSSLHPIERESARSIRPVVFVLPILSCGF
jgi:hypothetical protein